ncbi:hypothetical protein KKD03_02625 [Patescibacteria group bacterium]|nr:hypothetical protein [Patescibacteria group bacterium]
MQNQTIPENQYQEPSLNQELPPQPVKNNKLLLIALSLVSLVSISLAGFFGYKYYQIDKVVVPPPTPVQVIIDQKAPTPTITTIIMEEKVPIPTLDPTEGWETYANTIHNISFKYPSSWEVEEKIGEKENDQVFNTSVRLTKNDALIYLLLNVDGIGGQPRKYSGEQYNLDGHDLYKFFTYEDYNDMKKVGISNSLTTLGFFMIDDITYHLSLSYPNNTNKIEESNLLSEFDEILSTFKFTDEKK